MDFKFKKRTSQFNTMPVVLLESERRTDGGTWETKVREVPITMREVALLKKAHGTDAVNIARATKVKSLMLVGRNPLQIYTALRHLGRGYGLSSIKHDHAALSKR